MISIQQEMYQGTATISLGKNSPRKSFTQKIFRLSPPIPFKNMWSRWDNISQGWAYFLFRTHCSLALGRDNFSILDLSHPIYFIIFLGTITHSNPGRPWDEVAFFPTGSSSENEVDHVDEVVFPPLCAPPPPIYPGDCHTHIWGHLFTLFRFKNLSYPGRGGEGRGGEGRGGKGRGGEGRGQVIG